MSDKIILKGITWGHSRGITPLLAFSQRYNELNKNVEIQWHKRTLQEFADFPIEKLTETYDLLIVDHPWVGCAAATKCVLPLEQYISKEYLQNQEDNSVGYSHLSYNYNGSQWALAIDAATPVASYRKDLFEQNNRSLPQTWEDVIALAEEGKVAVPAIPIDLLMNFYTFCVANGNPPFANQEEVIDKATGLKALESMKALWSKIPKWMFDYNPIAVAELLSTSDEFWYCPLAYGYTNYSRTGYAKHLLHYTNVVSLNGEALKTTLGGTGISVSAGSNYKKEAVAFAEAVVSENVQTYFYTDNGGQPGHRKAWTNEHANAITSNFFANTLFTLDNAYIRPRYNGYLHFQDHAGDPIQQYLRDGGNPEEVLDAINVIYKDSLKHQ